MSFARFGQASLFSKLNPLHCTKNTCRGVCINISQTGNLLISLRLAKSVDCKNYAGLFDIKRFIHSSTSTNELPQISLKPNALDGNQDILLGSTIDPLPILPINKNDMVANPIYDVISEAGILEIELEQTIKDQLSLLLACLYSGNVERGRRMIAGLYNLYPKKMAELVDVKLHNTIIKSFLEFKPVRAREALGWYGKMQRDYSIVPDINTFAILIHGFLEFGLSNFSLLIIQELQKFDHKLDSLVLSPYMSDRDLEKVRQLTKGKFANNVGSLDSGIYNSLGFSESTINIQNYQEAAQLSSKDDIALSDTTAKLEDPQITLTASTGTQKIGSSMLKKITQNKEIISKNVANSATDSKIDGNVQKFDMPISVKKDHKDILGVHLLSKMLNPLAQKDLSDYKKQMLLETEAFESAALKSKIASESYEDGFLNSQAPRIKRYLAEWLPKLTILIEDEVKRCNQTIGTSKERSFYGPFLKLLPPEKVATITVLEVLRQAMSRMIKGADEKGPMNAILATHVVTGISKSLQSEYHHVILQKKENSYLLARNVEIQKMSTSGKLFNMTLRKAQAKVQRNLESSNWVSRWPVLAGVKLGSLLLAMFMEVSKIKTKVVDPTTNIGVENDIPAFTHGYWVNKGYRYGVVNVSNEFSVLLSTDPSGSLLNSRMLPMIVPPKPWLNYQNGGYLTHNSICMRVRSNQEQLQYLKHAAEQDKLSTVLSGLDVLGLTKWAINEPILKVALEVWNSGKSIAGIPPLGINALEPEKPKEAETDPKVYGEWKTKVKLIRNEAANNHSQRCDVNYKIAIARGFVGQPMYFPHDIDFRGRAYPIPPHFNNLGNDLSRGLLRFYDGKPLGQRGEYWLRIQLANCFGYDKFSHDERLQFTYDNWESIADSAKNPLTGKRWWLKAEDPWQTLAASMELVNAIESGDPKSYVSTLHVHQDGTCNGLQHYAALGRDFEGAKQVNLVPSDRPQDVYTAILNIVNSEIEKDYKEGVREAVLLRGHLKRKVVKQTVMTNVYGVTLIGAKEQISARLREIENPETGKCVFEYNDLKVLSLYLARKVFLSLGVMFESARKIQDWLNEAAKRISKSLPEDSFNAKKKITEIKRKGNIASKAQKQSKKPNKANKDALLASQLGETLFEKDADSQSFDLKLDESIDQNGGDKLSEHSESEANLFESDQSPADKKDNKRRRKIPVSKESVQYKRNKLIDQLLAKPMSSVVWTTPLGLTIVQPYRKHVVRNIKSNLQQLAVIDYNIPSPVNTSKQKTAFPPNFIHSLDASHMLLSAISCKKKNLTFSSVHDSYWTHACDIDIMNDVLREEFVKLHSTDILKNLKTEFEVRYGNTLIPVIPATKKSSKRLNKDCKKHDEIPPEPNKISQTNSLDDSENGNGNETLNQSEKLGDALPDHVSELFDQPRSEKIDNGIQLSSIEEKTFSAYLEDAEANDDFIAREPSKDNTKLSKEELESITKTNASKKPKNPLNISKSTNLKWVPFTLPDLPETGKLDIKDVENSPYFFS